MRCCILNLRSEKHCKLVLWAHLHHCHRTIQTVQSENDKAANAYLCGVVEQVPALLVAQDRLAEGVRANVAAEDGCVSVCLGGHVEQAAALVVAEDRLSQGVRADVAGHEGCIGVGLQQWILTQLIFCYITCMQATCDLKGIQSSAHQI